MHEEDAELLRRYADEKSEEAFAELVRRHLDLVYAVALRQVDGDAHLAQDVAQTVFTSLARKAASLAARPVLGGWLYRTTQYAAIDAVRADSRRRARETEAHIMHELNTTPGSAVDWDKFRPTLDQAIGELKDDDRDAVVLRFFEGKSFADVGARLRTSENTARMRVERALDKLRAEFEHRGVTSTTAALAAVLANQAVVAAPAGMVITVTGAALAGAGATVSGTTAGGGWVAAFMSMTKLQIGIAGAIALAGTTGLVVQASATAVLRDELAGLRRQNLATATMQTENVRLARTAGEAATARAQAAELAQLHDEATAIRSRLQAAAAAARATRVASLPKPVAPFTGQYFEPSQVDQQPKAVYQKQPMYPLELRKAGATGEATVDFVVDGDGVVRNATVSKTTHPAIGDAALEAVSQWKFDPAQKVGRAVAVHLQVPIVFTLSDDSKSAAKSGTPGAAKPPPTVPWF